MRVRTISPLALWEVRAWLRFIKQRMVLQFLPTVAFITVQQFHAAGLLILLNRVRFAPIRAILRLVREQQRVSAEILNVMSKWTRAALVVLAKRAEYRLQLIHIEIISCFLAVKLFGFYLDFIVCKRTKILVFALVDPLRIMRAKFFLVPLGMVELFHLILRKRTAVVAVTKASFNFRTQLRTVVILVQRPPPVNVAMIIRTQLLFMAVLSLARMNLEFSNIQQRPMQYL